MAEKINIGKFINNTKTNKEINESFRHTQKNHRNRKDRVSENKLTHKLSDKLKGE